MGTGAVKQGLLSRREFLRKSGQVGAGALALTLGKASALGAEGGSAGAREIRLTAREGTWELAPGKVTHVMAYNRQVPGPEIRVREGDQLRVVLRNHLHEPTAVHFHGIDEIPTPLHPHGIPMSEDDPGHSFVYEFPARPAGTRWYHPTHESGAHQIDLGLAGPLIVEPAGPEPFPFDREHTLLLDDWATGTAPVLPGTWEGTAIGGRAGMCGMMRGVRGARTWPYDTMTINGKAYPATQPLLVRRGERIRLRLLNVSNFHTHVIRLAGHPLHVTHTDGNPLMEPVEVDAVPIAPAERYDVLCLADRPGAWLLYCVEPGHAAAGEQVLFIYDGHERATADPPMEGVAGLRVWHYGLGRGRDTIPAPWGRQFDARITLMGMPPADVWMLNGRREPYTERLRLQRGDGARVLFVNMSMQAHPMHLHGQPFKVVAVNGIRLPDPLLKDVVDVHPHMGTVVIEFTAQFAGEWHFHCHKTPHFEGGMTTFVEVTG